MKGFETQDKNVDTVETWTLQQCEEYLAKYPNGLKAERIRGRIAALHKDAQEPTPHRQKQNKKQKSSTADSTKKQPEPRVTSEDNNDIAKTIGKIILSLLVISGGIGVFVLLSDILNSTTLRACIIFGVIVPLLKGIWE